MKKLIILLAIAFSLGFALPANAEEVGSFNEVSYNKVTALSEAIEALRKVSANGELSVLESKVKTIQEEAASLSSYDIAHEAPNDNSYKAAAEHLKTAATKLETVSKKMAEAAADEDDSLFVSYQKEYNGAVSDFNDAIKAYAQSTEQAAERVRIEQLAIIGSAVLTGIFTIAIWFWASSGDEAHRARARARRFVAIASLAPFIGALLTLGLYIVQVLGGYLVWLPMAVGVLTLLIVWVIYLIRRRRFTGFRSA